MALPEGAAGCSFSKEKNLKCKKTQGNLPAFLLEDGVTPKPEFITKLMLQTGKTRADRGQQLMDRIDRTFQIHFQVFSCAYDTSSELNKKTLKSCPNAPLVDKLNNQSIENNNKQVETELLIMRHGGEDLFSFLGNAIEKNDYTAEKTLILRKVIPLLFEAVFLLDAAKVVHGDIKLENVVIDANGKVNLIDFDQTRTYKEQKEYIKKTTFNKQENLPVDVYLFQEKEFQAFANTANLKYKNNPVFQAFMPYSVAVLKSKLESLLEVKKSLSDPVWFEKYMGKVVAKFNVYQLGHLMSYLLHYTRDYDFEELLVGMMDPNPENRLGAKEAYAEYKNVCEVKKGMDTKKFIKIRIKKTLKKKGVRKNKKTAKNF
jgi:hypothetical protein